MKGYNPKQRWHGSSKYNFIAKKYKSDLANKKIVHTKGITLPIWKKVIVKLLKGIVFIIWVGNKIIKLFKTKQMKISSENPPNYNEIAKVVDLHKGIIFTYGDTIYNPDNANIDRSLMKHEETHYKQQTDMGIDKWWDKYLADKEFRSSQELEAYQNQYKDLKKWIKDRELLFRYLRAMALSFSGEMYGNIISYEDAYNLIKNK